jgi:large subunit ribosomal protein L6
MSRVGKSPIPIPSGVDVRIDGRRIEVKGPKGTLERTFSERVGFTIEDGTVVVTRIDEERESLAMHGLSRSLLANMIAGVNDGFRKELQTVGVGYRAALVGSDIELQVGFSHPVSINAPDGITFEVPEPTRIIVSGIDKQLVGQVAASIRKVRPPEPYKGKGIRYVNEYVHRKPGKAGATSA